MKSEVNTHKANPKYHFVAVMVCSDADKSCPAVDGAVGRFAIPSNNPRYFNNFPSEKQKYDVTAAPIVTEMFYPGHQIKNKIIVQAELEK